MFSLNNTILIGYPGSTQQPFTIRYIRPWADDGSALISEDGDVWYPTNDKMLWSELPTDNMGANYITDSHKRLFGEYVLRVLSSLDGSDWGDDMERIAHGALDLRLIELNDDNVFVLPQGTPI